MVWTPTWSRIRRTIRHRSAIRGSAAELDGGSSMLEWLSWPNEAREIRRRVRLPPLRASPPGTFYNHFPSVDVFIDAVAQDLGTGIEIERDILVEVEHDPAARVAIGVLQLLEMADTDPVSAAAFVSLAAVRPDFRARIRALVGGAISDGVLAGSFDVSAGPAAVNAVLGATFQSMRSRVLGETDHTEAAAVAQLILRLLGVPSTDIAVTVDRAAKAVAEQKSVVAASGDFRA